MNTKIKKVAVLGSGVMGAQIAGHISNAGIQSYLFDTSQELPWTRDKRAPATSSTFVPCPLCINGANKPAGHKGRHSGVSSVKQESKTFKNLKIKSIEHGLIRRSHIKYVKNVRYEYN